MTFVPQRIFLSYGHDSNEVLVKMIKNGLEERGHDVWFDRVRIKSGDAWRRKITDGILSSSQMLSILSKYSTRVPGVCIDEIGIALGVAGCNIQTVLVESEAEVNPPPSISHIQWLDMHNWQVQLSAGNDTWNSWFQEKLDEIIRVVESDESRRFSGEIAELERVLTPVKSSARIADLIRRPLSGRGWMLDAVRRWQATGERDARLLLIVGDHGAGKSALSAHLAHYGRDQVIAAHFCEWNKPGHRDARQVIRSLSFQIAARLPDYRKLLLKLPQLGSLERMAPVELFDYLLTGPLMHAIDGNSQRYLILIDALDEASENGRNALADVLATCAGQLPEWLGIMVTSTPESEVAIPLQGLCPILLSYRDESNLGDIRDYLRRELESQLRGLAEADAVSVVEMAVKSSEGVFLYVVLFCDDIRSGNLTLDDPARFPRGLGGAYFQYFQRYFPNLDSYRKTIRPALRAIIAAREPLPLGVLGDLCDWDQEELHSFVRSIGSLFSVVNDGDGEVIKPIHKSLADWLADHKRSGPYFTSPLEGHRILADYCASSLEAATPELRVFAKRHLPYHLAQSGNGVALLSVVLDPNLRYFEIWAEHGIPTDGCAVLEYLTEWMQGVKCGPQFVPVIATQLARLWNRIGDGDRALLWLDVALSGEDAGCATSIVDAIALHEMGTHALSRRDLTSAMLTYRKALRIARRCTPAVPAEISSNLSGLATATYMRNYCASRALRLASLALAYARVASDPPSMAAALRLLADVNKDELNYESAEGHLEEGLVIARSAALAHATTALLVTRGWMMYQMAVLGRVEHGAAESALRDALAQAQQINDRRFIADAMSGLGTFGLLSSRREIVEAGLAHLEHNDAVRLPPHLHARSLLMRASLSHMSGDLSTATDAYRRTLKYCRLHSLRLREVDATIGLGAVAWHSGDTAQAEQHWDQVQEWLPECPRIRREIAILTMGRMRTDRLACPL